MGYVTVKGTTYQLSTELSNYIEELERDRDYYKQQYMNLDKMSGDLAEMVVITPTEEWDRRLEEILHETQKNVQKEVSHYKEESVVDLLRHLP